ncbi:MAG: metalloregulator ArsR/SmtB family transcription factor [Hyphomonadaceae bacterium]
MNTFTALADPTRRRILEMLAESDLAAGQIADRFDMTAAAVSQHLKALKEAGLVTVRAEAQRRIYKLSPEGFAEPAEWLDRTRGAGRALANGHA